MRACDKCGSRMPPYFPRKKGENGDMLCDLCLSLEAAKIAFLERRREAGLFEGPLTDRDIAEIPDLIHNVEEFVDSVRQCQENAKNSPTGRCEEHRHGREDWVASKMAVKKEAHDSGDGETIYHCPFCGAGGVMGRSDGTAECQFCGTSFTVQVQPSMSAMPQTIDGEPYANPEMPGEQTPPGEEVPGQEPEITETGIEEVGGEGGDVPNANPFTGEEPKAKNPFAAILRPEFKTASGQMLSEEDYLKHLAIRHADDREAVLAALRGR